MFMVDAFVGHIEEDYKMCGLFEYTFTKFLPYKLAYKISHSFLMQYFVSKFLWEIL